MARKNRQLKLWSFPRALSAKVFQAGDGKELRLYTLPALALMTGKSQRALLLNEDHGFLPKTPYMVAHEKKVFRYYTFDQMRVVREALHDIKLRGNREVFYQRVLAGWVIAGVPMAPGLDCEAALRLSAGSEDCEPLEKEFLLRALKAKKEQKNGKEEGGPVDGVWYYLKDESSETPRKKKSRRALAQQFNAICSGQSETVGGGPIGLTGRGTGEAGAPGAPLYTESGSRLWRGPRPGGVRRDSVDK